MADEEQTAQCAGIRTRDGARGEQFQARFANQLFHEWIAALPRAGGCAARDPRGAGTEAEPGSGLRGGRVQAGPVDRLDDDFPIRLTTGRRLDSYNTGVQSAGYTSPLRRGESLVER